MGTKSEAYTSSLVKVIYIEKGTIMKNNYWHFVGGILMVLLFALSSCGSTSGGDNGTSTSGPVSIRTDHSTYMPTDSIQVSVTNNLKTSIFAYDTRASCTILDLQIQVNGVWQATNVARCPLGRPAMRVEIPAGKTYTAKIQAGFPGLSQVNFPAGTYRLVLGYSTSATSLPQQITTTLYSATFSVTSSS
jgi:hypothetical protein